MTAINDNSPIYSDLASDPDLCELVELFVSEMPNRILSLEESFGDEDWPELTRIAHQLKGACGSYGFGELTRYALALEMVSREGVSRERIEHALGEFRSVANRVTAQAPLSANSVR